MSVCINVELGYRSVKPVKSMPTLLPASLRRCEALFSGGVLGSFACPSTGMLGRRKKGRHRTAMLASGWLWWMSAMAASRLRLPTKHQGHMRSLTTSTVTVGWWGVLDIFGFSFAVGRVLVQHTQNIMGQNDLII